MNPSARATADKSRARSQASLADELIAKYYHSRPGWVDGTTQFRRMIEKRLTADSHVLDVGAGSGREHKLPFRGKVRKFVGIDISDEVLSNPFLDEAFCCDAARMPFPDGSFDVAFSDFVFEHLANPDEVLREIFRVLKPGGYFCLRTPNKWNYVVVLSRLIPNRLHGPLVEYAQDRNTEDVFPTHYRINTAAEVTKAFRSAGFTVEELVLAEKEPSYLTRWPALFRIGVAWERTINSTSRLGFLRANLYGAFNKPC